MVPCVKLADPNVEPTDEELAALSRAARDAAIERHAKAKARFLTEMREALRASREQEAAHDEQRPHARS